MSRESMDFYPTPRWVAALCPVGCEGDVVFDPCAGEGDLLLEMQARGCIVVGFELSAERAALATQRLGVDIQACDSLRAAWPDGLVVQNPPFSMAHLFVRRAIGLGLRQATLLPLSWLEPAGQRRDLLALGPDVMVLPRRPSFTGNGNGFISCAWMCWPGSGRIRYAVEAASAQPSLFGVGP
jgi:hypothetical protein